MIRADLKCKMRGYATRPQDKTCFRKRITPLGTFAVIVHRFGRWVYSVKAWALPAFMDTAKATSAGFGYPQLQCHLSSRHPNQRQLQRHIISRKTVSRSANLLLFQDERA